MLLVMAAEGCMLSKNKNRSLGYIGLAEPFALMCVNNTARTETRIVWFLKAAWLWQHNVCSFLLPSTLKCTCSIPESLGRPTKYYLMFYLTTPPSAVLPKPRLFRYPRGNQADSSCILLPWNVVNRQLYCAYTYSSVFSHAYAFETCRVLYPIYLQRRTVGVRRD